MFLSFNENKLFAYFVIHFIEIQYFPFVKLWDFLIKFLALFIYLFFFVQNVISINLKGLSSSIIAGQPLRSLAS